MATNVAVPALGESVSEAVLVKWHKQDGEQVSADEALCELETEKANVDVPSPAAGVFKRTVKEGTTVHIGETIGTIDPAGKATAAPAKPAAPATPATAPAAAPATATSPARVPPPKTQAPTKADDGDYSPAVRRMLEEHKIPVAEVTGTGPGGRIL
jgi:2-oxoglutarate dehydrogenase E2 component (dihydrolipoamide succinyltransferase)